MGAALPKAAKQKIQPDRETQGFEDYPWRLMETFAEICPPSCPVWGILSHSRQGGGVVGHRRRAHPPQTGGLGPGPAKAHQALHWATGSNRPLPAQNLLTQGFLLISPCVQMKASPKAIQTKGGGHFLVPRLHKPGTPFPLPGAGLVQRVSDPGLEEGKQSNR